MRFALALLVTAACGPKVNTQPLTFDEDLSSRSQPAEVESVVVAPRPEAPPGKGLRNGVIQRDRLLAVLDGGAGTFLRQVEVTPRMNGDRFVGWQLVQLIDRKGPLTDLDLVPGDVLLAVNGKPVARPDQLQILWDSLRTANVVSAQLWRGEAKVSLEFTIEPAVAGAVAPPPPAADKAAPRPAGANYEVVDGFCHRERRFRTARSGSLALSPCGAGVSGVHGRLRRVAPR